MVNVIKDTETIGDLIVSLTLTYLYALPKGYYHKAATNYLKSVSNSGFSYSNKTRLDFKGNNFKFILSCSFCWDSSLEGRGYWEYLNRSLDDDIWYTKASFDSVHKTAQMNLIDDNRIYLPPKEDILEALGISNKLTNDIINPYKKKRRIIE